MKLRGMVGCVAANLKYSLQAEEFSLVLSITANSMVIQE